MVESNWIRFWSHATTCMHAAGKKNSRTRTAPARRTSEHGDVTLDARDGQGFQFLEIFDQGLGAGCE